MAPAQTEFLTISQMKQLTKDDLIIVVLDCFQRLKEKPKKHSKEAALEKELKSAHEKNEVLKEKIDALSKELNSALRLNRSLERQKIPQMKQELENESSQKNQLLSEVKHYKQKVKQLKASLKSLESNSQVQVNKILKEKAQVVSTSTADQATTERLQKEVKRLESELSQKIEKISREKHKSERLQDRIGVLEKQLEEVEKENEILLGKLSKSSKAEEDQIKYETAAKLKLYDDMLLEEDRKVRKLLAEQSEINFKLLALQQQREAVVVKKSFVLEREMKSLKCEIKTLTENREKDQEHIQEITEQLLKAKAKLSENKLKYRNLKEFIQSKEAKAEHDIAAEGPENESELEAQTNDEQVGFQPPDGESNLQTPETQSSHCRRTLPLGEAKLLPDFKEEHLTEQDKSKQVNPVPPTTKKPERPPFKPAGRRLYISEPEQRKDSGPPCRRTTAEEKHEALSLKVALQFPDELLVDSAAVAAEIETTSGAKTFILGDTSYGSCCVDEVAAEHVGADCIIHYGNACLSPSKRLPVMYVFEKRTLDVEKCAASFRDLYADTQTHILLLFDVNYDHAIGDLLTLLSPEYPNLVVTELAVEGDNCYSHGPIDVETRPSEDDNSQTICQFGRWFSLKSGSSLTDYHMFYVGQEGATLRNFMMTWNRSLFCSFDPVSMTGRPESVNVNRALMKRYYAIERAKDANVVGILVGTLGVADYLSIIQQLKETLHRAGKKSYMFAMGKLNVPKLANFLEIDIFVLIACPENSLLDSSEFYKPVVTPFEMEVACNRKREWSEEYVTDFRHLLPGGQSHVPMADQQEGDDETDVSLITGELRSRSLPSREPADSSFGSSVVLRNQNTTVADVNSAASFLAGRSWRGLEQKLGETPVGKAVQGRRGIAIAYEDEGAS